MRIALAFILGLIFLLSVLLDKTLRSLPAKELRRRARSQNDKKAAKIYKLATFRRSAVLFIWLFGAFSAAGLILLAAEAAWWAGLLATLLVLWLILINRTANPVDGLRLWLSALIARPVAAVVSVLQPILGRVTDWLKRVAPSYPATGLFEKEDLVEFLKIQARQPDNRISTEELKILRGAITLGDKTAGEIMLPRRKIKWVAAGDTIGPMVMDELHQTGQSRFPVVKEISKAANPEIVGVLYLKDLLDGLEEKGKIRGVMHPGIGYVNESQNLLMALDGFLKSGKYLLAVVNNFEEVVGVVTLEDLLGQIFGGSFSNEFDRYHDIRSVASHGIEEPQKKP